MMSTNKHKNQSGQALMTLLFFIIIATTVGGAAVFMIATNSTSETKFQQGEIAYEIAESGIQNGYLQLLRNPNYTGETLPVGSGSAVITVASSSAGTSYTLTSDGTVGNFSRTIQATLNYINYQLTIVSQQEIF